MRLWHLLPLLVLSLPAWGQQTYFRSQDLGNARILTYAWKDAAGDHAFKFALNLDDIKQAEQEFQPFDNTLAQTVAFRAVQAEAGKITLAGNTRLEVTQSRGGYDIRARGVEEAQMKQIGDQLQTARDQAMDKYIADKFYSKIDDVHIMPDHKRIAQRYVPAMAPLAGAIRAAIPNADQRATIDFTLHFIQSIPYDELENRYTSNGAGFETPYAILAGNKGDCDSKSVLLAATLRALYPTLRLTMVYVPDHAFIGVAMPQGPHDYALQLAQNTFVLADPTGPRLMNLGEVADRALAGLNGGQFSYQEVPF